MILGKMIVEEYELVLKHRVAVMDVDSYSHVEAEPDKRVSLLIYPEDGIPKEEIINRLFELLKKDMR